MSSKLIINADDYGLTESCSKAIAEAFEKNLISSTTACANGQYIEQALELAQEKGFVNCIGIHINLTEGKPLTEAISKDSFFCANGQFHGRIDRLKKPTKAQLAEIKEEVTAQVERLLAIGYTISHADSHHHIHTCIYFEDTIKDVLFAYGIKKIRLHRNIGKISFYKKIVKNWYNRKLKKQGFTTCRYFGSLEDFEPNITADGVCEIMVHPDYNPQGILIDRVKQSEEGNFGELLGNINLKTATKEKISYRDLS